MITALIWGAQINGYKCEAHALYNVKYRAIEYVGSGMKILNLVN